MSRAVAGTDIDKPLGRGYALVTDPAPAVTAFIITAAGGAIVGTITATFTYARTGDARRAALCATWITFHGIMAGFAWFMPLTALPAADAWGVYRGAITAVGAGFIC